MSFLQNQAMPQKIIFISFTAFLSIFFLSVPTDRTYPFYILGLFIFYSLFWVFFYYYLVSLKFNFLQLLFRFSPEMSANLCFTIVFMGSYFCFTNALLEYTSNYTKQALVSKINLLYLLLLIIVLTALDGILPRKQLIISISAARMSCYFISGIMLMLDVFGVSYFNDLNVINAFGCFVSFDTVIVIYRDISSRTGHFQKKH